MKNIIEHLIDFVSEYEQFLYVGTLYKLNTNLLLRLHEGEYKSVKRGTIVLLIEREKLENGGIRYVFLCGDKRYFYVNHPKFEGNFYTFFSGVRE